MCAEENEEDAAAGEHLLVINVGEADRDVKFRIRNLTKKSESREGGGAIILNELSVDIPKGVIVGVIGPSGSGKSTLLRALNRLWEPPAGTVFLDGHDIRDLDVLSLRRKVGMLFQLPVLFEGTHLIDQAFIKYPQLTVSNVSLKLQNPHPTSLFSHVHHHNFILLVTELITCECWFYHCFNLYTIDWLQNFFFLFLLLT